MIELAPKVFISYSRDSQDHNEWVRNFATRLRIDGVDVILDQWDLGLGQDVTAFMEQSLGTCERVLIICTEEYVRKANTLKGGVGYERMIVTAEIANDLETNKFIPVLRNGNAENLPKFLGKRIYVDFRSGESDEHGYKELLYTLHKIPMFEKPNLGESPFQGGQQRPLRRDGALMPTGDGAERPASGHLQEALTETKLRHRLDRQTKYHWHRAVHQYCGNTLYLIFLRFATGSIFFKDSVLNDLRLSGISDYMSFHLYSNWDLLIRAWADKDSFENFRERLSKNPELHPEKQPEYLVVHDLNHWPEGATYRSGAEVADELSKIAINDLRDVQERGEQSEHFAQLREQGLLLEDTGRFHPDRIQFYITIRSVHPIESAEMRRLEQLIGSRPLIANKSMYKTMGSSVRVVVKGQVEHGDYYTIHDFLQAVTEELRSEGVVTETMFVATPDPRQSGTIDFKRAEVHLAYKEFRELVPGAWQLGLAEQRKLEGLYASVREKLSEDRDDILRGLIKAKAANSLDQLGHQLTLFSSLEQSMRAALPSVILKAYGVAEWQETLDNLKTGEGLSAKTIKQFVLGDYCKIYKEIVLEKQIIDIAPLSEEEFARLMAEDAPNKRNELHHRGPDMRRWDDLFSFWSEFMPVYSRLMTYIGKVRRDH